MKTIENCISYGELLHLLKEHTKRIEVAVRDNDFYAKRDDYTFEYLDVVDVNSLVEALEEAIRGN